MKMDVISLADTTSFIVDNRGKTVPTVDSGIPLIKTNCITNTQLYPRIDGAFYVLQETYDSWFRAHPIPGDIILTLKGSQNGAVCLVPNPVSFVIAQDMVALRVNDEVINSHYLLAALRSREVQHQIKTLDVSGVIPHLKKTDFDKLILPYPSREIQDYIGELYYKLSSKIELLRQQNQTLEELAQTLFKRWFVEFEFPVSEADIEQSKNGNGKTLDKSMLGKSYRSSGGLMVESELGEIPEGWEMKEINEILSFVVDNRGKTAPISDGGIPLIATNCVKNSNVHPVFEKVRFISSEVYENWFRAHPEPGDVLFVNKGTPGCINLVPNPVGFCIAQDMIALRTKKDISNVWLFLYLRSFAFQSEIKNISVGTTIPHLKKTDLLRIELIVPQLAILSKFHKTIKPLFGLIENNTKEIQTLTQLRDTLLPKLMSGELRVKMSQPKKKSKP